MSVKYILLTILISPIFCEISNIDPEDVFRLQNQTITETDFNDQIEFDSNLNSNFSNLVRISDLLDVFNIENIGSMWSTFGHKLNKNCSADMVKYLKGLQSGQSWAIKSKFFLIIIINKKESFFFIYLYEYDDNVVIC